MAPLPASHVFYGWPHSTHKILCLYRHRLLFYLCSFKVTTQHKTKSSGFFLYFLPSFHKMITECDIIQSNISFSQPNVSYVRKENPKKISFIISHERTSVCCLTNTYNKREETKANPENFTLSRDSRYTIVCIYKRTWLLTKMYGLILTNHFVLISVESLRIKTFVYR